jgi:hypothetical protein
MVGMTNKQKPLKYEEMLEDAFAFDVDSLRHNAQGQLSHHQRMKLKSRFQNNSILLFFAVMAFIAALTLIRVGAVAYIVMLISLVGGGVLALQSLRLTSDLNANDIETIEGRIHLDVQSGGQNSVVYQLQIGDMKFTLNKKKFLALKNGDPYRIYYLPSSKRILSVEWLYSDESRDESVAEAAEPSSGELVDDESSPLVDDFGAESRTAQRR